MKLYELRDQLADVMGVGPKDAHEADMRRYFNRVLIDTQARLYRLYTFDGLKRWWELDVVANVNLYDYPSTVNAWAAATNIVVNQIVKDSNNNYQSAGNDGTTGAAPPAWNAVTGGKTVDNGVTWLNLGPTAPPAPDPLRFYDVRVIYNNAWLPMAEGIPSQAYTLASTMFPRRYAHRQGQFEVWPTPDAAYTVMIFAYQALNAFAADTDELTLDRDLVYLTAVASCKASPKFKHPDAAVYAQDAERHRRKLVAQNFGNKRFIPGADPGLPVRPMPVIVNPE
ncbi:MAG TPA: hypothetical protein VNE18_10425 [Rhodanobacter sp.]|nr:hypothetical protein [Rhodanobacter sp.]